MPSDFVPAIFCYTEIISLELANERYKQTYIRKSNNSKFLTLNKICHFFFNGIDKLFCVCVYVVEVVLKSSQPDQIPNI